MKNFDVVVIGTGAGGTAVAFKCAAARKKVAIIDSNPYGGTCQLRGCDPKKILIGISEAIDLSNRLQNKGLVSAAKASWKDMLLFKNTFIDPKPQINEANLNKAGVISYHGRARFISEKMIQIGQEQISGDKFVLANGSKPIKLGIAGEELLIDSTTFLDLEELPDEILFVGGGYIAFEFGHLAARLGVKVQIIHRGALPLENFDRDLVKDLLRVTEELGIKVVLNTLVTGISTENDKVLVHTSSESKTETFTASVAVHAAGRTADIEGTQLDKINVVYGNKGVDVNELMQSVSNPNVFASGDVNNRGLPLTPVAGKESMIVASNLLKGNHLKIDYGYIPSNMFTLPVLASLGLTEQEAERQGLNYTVNYSETTEWFSSKRLNEPVSSFKVLLDKNTDKIRGAHLSGPNAEEVINVFAVAMNAGVRGGLLKKMIFSYPTNSSDIVYML
jgi:glutathione reductase (NADPH)